MSHIICKYCGSNDHSSGYGLACGPMGAYTICNNCDRVLEFSPDTEGMTEEAAKALEAKCVEWLSMQAVTKP